MTDPAGTPAGPATYCYRHPDRPAYIQCQRCGRHICPEDMRAASVGFQCPECVAAGQKAVRQPRTMAGGAISTDVGALTFAIIGINVAAQVLVMAQGGPQSSDFWQWGAMWGFGVAQGEYWRLLTAAFLHGGLLHLALNMYALYLFGPFIEHALGRWRYVLTYLTLAAGSSVFVYWLESPNVPTIGASGAVFGLFGLALVFLIRAKQSITGMLVLLAINAVISLNEGISWQGHLGGFVLGCLLGLAFAYAPRERRTAIHLALFAGLWVVLAVAVAVRTAELQSQYPALGSPFFG